MKTWRDKTVRLELYLKTINSLLWSSQGYLMCEHAWERSLIVLLFICLFLAYCALCEVKLVQIVSVHNQTSACDALSSYGAQENCLLLSAQPTSASFLLLTIQASSGRHCFYWKSSSSVTICTTWPRAQGGPEIWLGASHCTPLSEYDQSGISEIAMTNWPFVIPRGVGEG